MHLDLVQSRTALIGGWLLRSIMIRFLFPLAVSLLSGASRPLFPFTSGRIGSCLCGRWWRRAACNAWRRWIWMVLVWRTRSTKVTGRWRWSWVANKWSDLRLLL